MTRFRLVSASIFILGAELDAGTPPPTLSQQAPSEAITDVPAESAQGNETPPRDPFGSYEIGPQGTRGWTLDQLPDEVKHQVVAPQNPPSASTLNIYGETVSKTAVRAKGIEAARLLGLEHLERIGVIP